MKSIHLSKWDQEEYVLGQRTPEMVSHLAECSVCRAGVARMEHGVTLFKNSAMEWSGESLGSRIQALPMQLPHRQTRRLPFPALKWAIAAILLVLALLPLYLLGNRAKQQQAAKANKQDMSAPISDDALLQQVDEEVSVAVPSSMEPLTHLVTANPEAGSNAIPSAGGSQHHAQTN
jgi:hypothetical protein